MHHLKQPIPVAVSEVCLILQKTFLFFKLFWEKGTNCGFKWDLKKRDKNAISTNINKLIKVHLINLFDHFCNKKGEKNFYVDKIAAVFGF